jgi:hypothetical protein
VLSICFASVWEVLQNKFKKDGEFYFNERLRQEIDKRKSFTESRRINALHPKKKQKAYAQHMGDGNENGNKDKDKKEKVKKSFNPPTIEEIKSYCLERKNKVNPQLFLDKYTGNGWMVGKNKMKDWKAVIRTWEINDFGGNNATGNNTGFKANSYRGNNNNRELDPKVADECDKITAKYFPSEKAANGNT